jgi:molybdate transport system substrate-binding protein
MNALRHFAALLALAASLLHPTSAMADQLTVYSTVAAKGALELIAPDFERASGQSVRFKFGTAAELKAEIEKGASFDVALLTASAIDDLIKQSRLVSGSKTLVFKSGVGVAAKKGAAAPAVTTLEELKAAVLAAKAVALSTQGATGPIVRRAFEKLGITEAMAPKLVLVSDMTAPEAVVRGRAELAFTQISEILDTPDAQLLGPLPADLQSFTVFAAGTAPDTKAIGTASAFLKALASPMAQSQMRAKGLLPD